jgi:hypothetical protein
VPNIDDPNERFSVYQFLLDGTYEKVREGVTAKYAVHAAYHYSHSVAAVAGVTRRVIIVDSGDCIAFEWRFGEGVVYPPLQEDGHRKYGKLAADRDN